MEGIFIFVVLFVIGFALFSFGKKIEFNGKHCYITGGSKGTGKALALLLAERGAHITIVARAQKDLDAAVVEIKVF